MRRVTREFCGSCWPAALCGVLALGGCGEWGAGSLKQEVSGTVMLDDHPLADGNIQFMPASEQDRPTAAMAAIQSGRYAIPRDQGLATGSYSVRVSRLKQTGPAPKADDIAGVNAPTMVELIPAQYNVATTLTAEVKKGPNSIDFSLTTK